jgi:hypothetical protein
LIGEIKKKQEEAFDNMNMNEGVKRESKLAYFETINSNQNKKGGCC